MSRRPEIFIAPSSERLIQEAAARIASALADALDRRARISFVLTGGNTPKPLYRLLAEAPLRDRLDWRRMEFYWGDERTVPPDHPDSNYGMARSTLLSRLPVSEPQIHRIAGELADPEAAALRYEAEIQSISADSSDPIFDVVLLGMGDDGHTASLFPGMEWDEDRAVVANYIPKLQSSRISMTPKALNAARAVFFLVSGPSKAKVLPRVLEDRDPSLPAARIQPTQGSLVWLLDRAAASELSDPSISKIE